MTNLQLFDAAQKLQNCEYTSRDGILDEKGLLNSGDTCLIAAYNTVKESGYDVNSNLSIDLVIAMNALYRPGPMEYIGDYIEGRLHPETIVYDCPQIKPILEPTFGVIVYQEQVMQIVRDLAGYSWGRSDLIRRAMSKKHQDEIDAERTNFVYGNEELDVPGCVKNGISEDIANRIYDKMIDFAKYAFNKSHAAAYSVTSFYTAYCKEYFPAEYLCECMNYAPDISKISNIIEDARNAGIEILPPDINTSNEKFDVINGKIYYGLSNIKGVGNAATQIIEERKKLPFMSFKDFLIRGHVDSGATKALIEAGAFDCFSKNRGSLFTDNEWIQDLIKLVGDINKKKSLIKAAEIVKTFVDEYDSIADLKDRIAEEGITFPITSKKYPTKDSIDIKIINAKKKISEDIAEMNFINLQDYQNSDFSTTEILFREKNVLGLYLTSHPIDEYQIITTPISDLIPGFDNISGIIEDLKTRKDRSGKHMATFNLTDRSGSIRCVCFSSNFEKIQNLITENAAVKLSGKLIRDDFNSSEEEEVLMIQVKSAEPLRKKAIIYQATLSLSEYVDAYSDILSYKSNSGCALLVIDSVTGLTRKTSFDVSKEIINLPYVVKVE